VAEPRAAQAGLREVLLVGALVVAVVLGAAALTSVLPDAFRQLVLRTPLTIVVLIGGTALVLWRLTRRPPA
jgi:hypothetical protein